MRLEIANLCNLKNNRSKILLFHPIQLHMLYDVCIYYSVFITLASFIQKFIFKIVVVVSLNDTENYIVYSCYALFLDLPLPNIQTERSQHKKWKSLFRLWFSEEILDSMKNAIYVCILHTWIQQIFLSCYTEKTSIKKWQDCLTNSAPNSNNIQF